MNQQDAERDAALIAMRLETACAAEAEREDTLQTEKIREELLVMKAKLAAKAKAAQARKARMELQAEKLALEESAFEESLESTQAKAAFEEALWMAKQAAENEAAIAAGLRPLRSALRNKSPGQRVHFESEDAEDEFRCAEGGTQAGTTTAELPLSDSAV
jgi:hypothetical protein